jgi:putative ABC transport system permease protein
MGLPIRAGRAFRAGDEASVLPLAVVSESLGRLIERGGAAIGRRISFVFGRLEDFEVVGVVTDHRLVGEHEALAIYALEEHLRVNTYSRTAYVRSATSDTAPAARALRDAVQEVDERGVVASVRLMREVILDQMSTQVFGLSVMAALGTIALVLTGVGIYVLAETIARSRRREMSIRAALGASVWQMASSLIVESFRLVGIGTLLGLGIAWLGAGAIQAFLVGIQPMDWVTLVSVSALIFLLAVAVGLEPAFAAVRADVASTLREE